MENFKYHLLVILATTLVAGSFIASEKIAGIVNPVSLTLLRFLGASVILLPFVLMRRKWRNAVFFTLPRAFIISFFYAGFFIGFFESLNTTTSLNTGALFTLVPLLTALLSIAIFKEKITRKMLVVYIMGIFGTMWVVFGGEIKNIISFSLNQGDYIFLVAILFMSLYSISMKMLYRNDEMIVLVFCTLIGGSVWLAIALYVLEEPLQWSLLLGEATIYMAYLIIGATLATVYLYQVTTVALGPGRVNSYIYLNPAIVSVLILVVNGKSIPVLVIPGILISILATIILQVNKAEMIKT